MLDQTNAFHREGNVFVLDKSSTSPETKGDDVERYLEKVLRTATDLSSYSEELESLSHDWTTEYHLSRKRANLLRGFDFSKVSNALELGCACGSITRFLGEQGVAVDAVEHNHVSAQMAALRCRDLDHVQIFNAGFNDLEWPDNAYDAVVLIGIFAYATKFVDDTSESAEAVKRILAAANRAVKPDGIIIIATENRLGMKYVLGANEEHSGRQFMGIHGYFGQSDMRTYSRDEWTLLLEQFGFEAVRTYLPFPDFKIPTVILSEEFTLNSPYAFCHLEGLNSRDYVMPTNLGVTEPMFWQSSNIAGTMPQHSNSFLFICSPSGSVSDFGRFDFLHLPSFFRETEFSVITGKPADQDTVSRRRLVEGVPKQGRFQQQLIAEKYHHGSLLSAEWIRTLLIEPDGDRFLELVRKYIDYLNNLPYLTIDLLPKNIIVTQDGNYEGFDQEWVTDHDITPSFLLFRALLNLPLVSISMMRPYFKRHQLGTVRDFIVHVGNEVDVKLSNSLDEFIELEEEFQSFISKSRESNLTMEHLDARVASAEIAKTPTRARIYWACEGENYSAENVTTFFFDVSDDVQTVTVDLPPRVSQAASLRFDPCDEGRQNGVGFMRFHSIELTLIDPFQRNLNGKAIWRIEGQGNIAKSARMSGVIYKTTNYGEMFAVTDDDPWFEFQLSPPLSPTNDLYLQAKISISLPVSEDYLLAKDAFLQSEQKFGRKLVDLDNAYRRINELEEELSQIKDSRSWQMISAYRRVFGNKASSKNDLQKNLK